ncbi:MAG: MGMT family protein [Candidatus Pacearchaeota archaeon]
MDLKNQIYSNLKKVPKGKVITYKSLGDSVNSKAYRFIGKCMANNPNFIENPCYKVVLSNGKVGNYSGKGGINKKVKKLKDDGIKVTNGKVDLFEYGYKFL